MNEQELNDLFDKARNQNSIIPPDEVLTKGLSKSHNVKFSFSKAVKFISVAFAAIVIVVLLIVNPNSEMDKRESTPTAFDKEKDKDKSIVKSDLEAQTKADSTDANSLSIFTQTKTEVPLSIYSKPKRTIRLSKPNTADPMLNGDIAKLLSIQSIPSEFHTIDNTIDTILETKKGSRFFIESYSFQNSSNEVIDGTINFELKECFNPGEFMRENLSTSNGDFLLESGGMFYINAYKNKDTLKIRQGYEIGYRPAAKVEDRMDLYYGNRDEEENITWDLDSVGKISTPTIVSFRGKYGGVMNPWFNKNYKLRKETMLALRDSTWINHFTSDDRVLWGYRSCADEIGPFKEACDKFNTDIAVKLAKHPNIHSVSRMTEFTFICMGKNQYAFANMWGAIDSFRSYVAPIDFNVMNIPILFPRNLGWGNIDCIPDNIRITWKKRKIIPKADVQFKIPHNLRSNAFVYIPSYNAMSRASNLNSTDLTFKDLPENEEANLVITALYNDEFLVYKTSFNTSSPDVVNIVFERINDAEVYKKWLDEAIAKPKTL